MSKQVGFWKAKSADRDFLIRRNRGPLEVDVTRIRTEDIDKLLLVNKVILLTVDREDWTFLDEKLFCTLEQFSSLISNDL